MSTISELLVLGHAKGVIAVTRKMIQTPPEHVSGTTRVEPKQQQQQQVARQQINIDQQRAQMGDQ